MRNENRSAPSGIPAASSGSPTQACSSPVSRTAPGAAVGVRLRLELGPQLLGVGDEHRPPGRDRAGHHARGVQRQPHAGRVRAGRRQAARVDHPQAELVVLEQRHRRAQAPIAVRPTSVITSTTCSTSSASASIAVACCSRAVRSAAADSWSVSRCRISSASRWLVTSVQAPTHSAILPSRSIGTDAHVVVPVPAAPGPHPEPLFEQPAGPQRLPPVPLDPLAVLRVDGLQPAVAEELVHGLPGDPAPLGRVLEHLPLGGGHPGDLRAALDEGAVPLLAAPQRLLGGQARRCPRSRSARPRDSVPSGRCTPNQWKIRWPGCALPADRAGGERLHRRAPLGEHLPQRRLGPGGVHRGPDLGHQQAGEVRHRRPNSSASAALTQTKRMSVPRTAIPADASRKTASGSQDSNSVNPASRCFGTEVSALNEHLAYHAGACHWRLLPALPCQPRHTSLPGAWRQLRRQAAGAARTAFIQNKRATIQDAMLPANCTEAKRESPPTPITATSPALERYCGDTKSRHGRDHGQHEAQ